MIAEQVTVSGGETCSPIACRGQGGLGSGAASDPWAARGLLCLFAHRAGRTPTAVTASVLHRNKAVPFQVTPEVLCPP